MSREIALSLQENDNLLQTTFTYPTDIPPLNSTVKTLIPFDDSLSPLVNLETRTSSSITISRSTTLSSSSSEKSFDPFGLTYFSNLIPSLLAPDTSTEIKESTTLDTTTNDQPSSNKELYQLVSTSTIPAAVFNTYGDLFDDTDEEDDHFLYNLIDLNLLDDYALDSTASTSDSEPSLTTYTDGHLSNFRDTSMMIHDLPLFPSPTTTTAITTSPTYLSSSFSSLSSASSSSTISSSATFTTSPSMMMNIWTNNYSRYHDPFDDDEFDPTQPLSSTSPPSLSSSPETSTLSPPYSYQSTAASLSTATGTTAIDMLMALLPHYTRQQVVSTLSSANYDMDHLLVLLSSDGRSSVSYTKKRQICRHFLMGDCLRQDCRFAHDISIKVCRFWLQDKCLKGNQCEFAHSMESICIQDQDDFIDHNGTTTTGQSKSNKSSRSKKKNKSDATTLKSKTDQTWMDAYQDQEHDYLISSKDLVTATNDGKRFRRRQQKKIKRKSSTVSSASSLSSSSLSSTKITPNVTLSQPHNTIHLTSDPNNNNNNKIRHCRSFEDCPLGEDFPALSSPFATTNPVVHASSMTLSPHVLALNSISTNFAQVVARNKK